MKKFLQLACLVLSFASAATAQAAAFQFSFTFENSTIVTGTLDGTQIGDLVTDVSNIYLYVNGVGFPNNGNLHSAGKDWANEDQWGPAILSFDGNKNNFLMANEYGQFSIYWWFDPLNAALATIWFPGVNPTNGDELVYDGRKGGIPQRWNLSPVAAIPEPGQYAMLLAGLGIIGVAVRRRRFI
jgi:hypothetical protein